MSKNKTTISSQLKDGDFKFLAVKYEVEVDFLRTLNDDDWCHFLVCEPDELRYFLLEDDTLPMPSADEYDAWRNILDSHSLDYIEEVDEYEDEAQVNVDIDEIIANDFPKPATLFSLSKPKVIPRPVYDAAKYRKPSPMAKKNIVVNHHFEIVR